MRQSFPTSPDSQHISSKFSGPVNDRLDYRIKSGDISASGQRSGTIKRPVGGAVNHLRRLFANSKAMVLAGLYFDGDEAADWLQRYLDDSRPLEQRLSTISERLLRLPPESFPLLRQATAAVPFVFRRRQPACSASNSRAAATRVDRVGALTSSPSNMR